MIVCPDVSFTGRLSNSHLEEIFLSVRPSLSLTHKIGQQDSFLLGLKGLLSLHRFTIKFINQDAMINTVKNYSWLEKVVL